MECLRPEGAPEELSLETTPELLERRGRLHVLRQAVPQLLVCQQQRHGQSPIVEVGCDGQRVLRSSLNEVAAVSRLMLETRSRSAEQTSIVETLFTPFTTAADIHNVIHI